MKRVFFFLLAVSFGFCGPLQSAERPHVILIMVDDMGFSDLGYHGGDAETPNLDSLARGGVRFSQFYNSARCCPTRATLMTGLHPHQTGIGWMTERPGSDRGETEPPAYQGHLNQSCVTIAEALRESGYATMMAGKWHLGHRDRDDWPLQRGFEKYFGCISGATRFFYPHGDRGMTFGNDPVPNPVSTTDEAFYTTDAFTGYGIRFLKEELEGQKRPSFLYLAFTAPHWPLQAFEDDIARYRGKFKDGWDAMRERRHQRQVELGLIQPDWKLSPRTPGIPDWNSLDEKKRDEMDLKMAVYTAMIDRVDQNIGKLVAFLKESGLYENTFILFLSDNGACQEGGMLGRGEFFDAEKRNQEDENSYGEAWANASNTPFRLYKHFAHEGGASSPFFMHWPAKIRPQADWFSGPGQLIDIMPTILDVAGAGYPEKAKGNEIPALDGISLRPAFASQTLNRKDPIFIEHETNAFVRDGNWKLVGREVANLKGTDPSRWELYDMLRDRTETIDLASKNSNVVKALAAKWEAWAERVKVYPRGENSPKRGGEPAGPDPQADPNPPQIQGRAFSVTATVRNPKPQGVAVSHGGVQFGYALHFVDGKPAFSMRDKGSLTTVMADNPVEGKVTVKASLDAAKLTIFVNGEEVASRESPGLFTGQPAIGKYVGLDFKDPVGDYKAPNRFNGKILAHSVDVEIPKVAMRTEWGEKVTPENAWQEYPRPQMRRDNWTNLNGRWDYAVTPKARKNTPEKWDGKILVPFAIEAPLSGVERRITPDDALWYRRSVAVEKKEGKRFLLNFEAVDYQSTVWVNGREVGSNTGGNLPFSFDATEALKDGENELVVRVTDATDTAYQQHGKQVLQPGGIWYTPVTGIWQTVWMEEAPENRVEKIAIDTKADGSVTIRVDGVHAPHREVPDISISFDGTEVSEVSVYSSDSGFHTTISNPKLWSPDSPSLYDVKIKYGEDIVHSYFGIRETGIANDADGRLRFMLNGKPIFHWGPLDQGWWPDGLLTPPSDAAMRSDIEFLKAAGFNTIRKHIKVEPRRYYYHCDKIGMMLWQDQPSSGTGKKRGEGNSSAVWTRLEPNPVDAIWPDGAHEQYMKELEKMIENLENHPSIVQWVPFNESWGQHRSMEVGKWTTERDPTRQVNIASGGNWYPVGHVVDHHQYPHPGFPFEFGEGGRFDGFVKVVGEFGGHGFPVEGHLWSSTARNWGYGGLPKDKDEWRERYRTSIEMLAELKKQGIAGGIYTQTTDVEGEINGLITYDRKVKKIAPAELKKISSVLFAE